MILIEPFVVQIVHDDRVYQLLDRVFWKKVILVIWYFLDSKGQLISKWLCGVFDFLKKTNENRFLDEIERFSFVLLRKSKTPKTISNVTDLYHKWKKSM